MASVHSHSDSIIDSQDGTGKHLRIIRLLQELLAAQITVIAICQSEVVGCFPKSLADPPGQATSHAGPKVAYRMDPCTCPFDMTRWTGPAQWPRLRQFRPWSRVAFPLCRESMSCHKLQRNGLLFLNLVFRFFIPIAIVVCLCFRFVQFLFCTPLPLLFRLSYSPLTGYFSLQAC